MKLIFKFFISILILLFLIYTFSRSNLLNEQENSLKEYVNVFPPFQEIYKFKKIDFDASEINGKIDKYFFDKKLRNRLFDSANMLTEPDTNPNANLIYEIDKGDYIERKLSITFDGSVISYAYFLIPKNISYPAPLILAMHGHGDNYFGKEWVVGKKGSSDGSYGKELVEKGYIVFASDAPLFGDRLLYTESKENSSDIIEQFGFQSLSILGHSLLGETLKEDISILNFLTSLDKIDKNNIGCIGHSFGGVRCMYLAALDKRIKAVVLSNSVADLRKNEKGIKHTWFGFIPGIGSYTETNGILALIAPRPLMIVYSENDPIFPLKEAEEQIAIVNRLYERLGYKDNFNFLLEPNEEHTFPKKYREDAYKFLDKYLK